MPLLVASGGGHAPLFSPSKDRIVGVNRVNAGGAEAAVSRDAFHSGRDEGITFAGLDRMEGDPGSLHTGRAEAVDRRCRDVIEP